LALIHTDVPIPRPAENRPIQATGWLAGLGAVTGLGALAASSCCALPLALAGLGAGSAVFGGLEILANWRPLLLGGAMVVVLAAWILHFRRRSVACNVDGSCSVYAASKSARVLLSLGTGFVVLSVAWDPYIEPLLLKLVR
jgi:mercuric ion transport protein